MREDVLAAAQRQLNIDPTSSMADIAAAAGIGRATLHRHFASREALLDEIGVRSVDRWEQRLDEADVERVAGTGEGATMLATLHELIRGFVVDADDFGFSLTDADLDADAVLGERQRGLFEREVQFYAACQQAGVLRGDVSARWLARAVYGLLVSARDAMRSGEVALRDLEDLVITTFLEGGRSR